MLSEAMLKPSEKAYFPCTGCIHHKVCKYTEEYERLKRKLFNDVMPSFNADCSEDDLFTVELNCIYSCYQIGGVQR